MTSDAFIIFHVSVVYGDMLFCLPVLTRSKIDDNVYEEYCVWEAVEGDPACGEVVVEEGDGHRQDDEVGDQEEQHAQVPVESATQEQARQETLSAARQWFLCLYVRPVS